MSRSVGFLSVGLSLAVVSPAGAVADGASIVVEVDGLRSGRGAVRGALERDFVGWLQEGFGFSNDARPGLGPSSYESAAFEHGAGITTLTVHARYGL
jgi:uncharacterized protein (DUF2141 family)